MTHYRNLPRGTFEDSGHGGEALVLFNKRTIAQRGSNIYRQMLTSILSFS